MYPGQATIFTCPSALPILVSISAASAWVVPRASKADTTPVIILCFIFGHLMIWSIDNEPWNRTVTTAFTPIVYDYFCLGYVSRGVFKVK
jgi:hypothetical protein